MPIEKASFSDLTTVVRSYVKEIAEMYEVSEPEARGLLCTALNALCISEELFAHIDWLVDHKKEKETKSGEEHTQTNVSAQA